MAAHAGRIFFRALSREQVTADRRSRTTYETENTRGHESDDRACSLFESVLKQPPEKRGSLLRPLPATKRCGAPCFFWKALPGIRDLMLEDGIHPNHAGYKFVTANAMKNLEPLLKKQETLVNCSAKRS